MNGPRGFGGMCPQSNLAFSLEEAPTFGRGSSLCNHFDRIRRGTHCVLCTDQVYLKEMDLPVIPPWYTAHKMFLNDHLLAKGVEPMEFNGTLGARGVFKRVLGIIDPGSFYAVRNSS